MPIFVVDASVAAGWFIADEANDISTRTLNDLVDGSAIVPDLFWHAIRNLLTSASRRKRIQPEDVKTSMIRLRALNISAVANQSDDEILSLASRHRLSAYDAAYLALAGDAM